MNTSITLRKLAIITAGLVLTATASVGHAQQKWMEQVLDQSLQNQQVAEQSADDQKKTETQKDADEKSNTAREIEFSNTYDDEGNPII